MEIMKKLYAVEGWRGYVHFLTAEELYERVMEDSKSNYNWIASATELVRICSKKSFPKEYANEIKIAILNCFANIWLDSDEESRCLDTDYAAVSYCYSSLSEGNEKIIIAKQNYLRSVIKAVALNHYELPIHFGPIYLKMRDEWIESKFDENINREKIDRDFLEYLNEDFDTMIKNAEKEGVLEEEDKERIERIADYAFKLCD